MYQFIVIGLGFLLLIGGGFLINHEDSSGLLGAAFSSDIRVLDTAAAEERVEGVFVCGKGHGCVNEYTLKFNSDNNVEMIVSYEDGTEYKRETGTWKFEKGGIMNVSLTESSGEEYEFPHNILVKSIKSDSLYRLSYDTSIYSDMRKPVFMKVGEEE